MYLPKPVPGFALQESSPDQINDGDSAWRSCDRMMMMRVDRWWSFRTGQQHHVMYLCARERVRLRYIMRLRNLSLIPWKRRITYRFRHDVGKGKGLDLCDVLGGSPVSDIQFVRLTSLNYWFNTVECFNTHDAWQLKHLEHEIENKQNNDVVISVFSHLM